MPRTADVNNIEIVLVDQAVEMDVDEVQPGRRAPVTEQARLHVLTFQWFAQQWIGVQVDLANREVVGRTPIGVHLAQLFWRQWLAGEGETGRMRRCERCHRTSVSRLLVCCATSSQRCKCMTSVVPKVDRGPARALEVDIHSPKHRRSKLVQLTRKGDARYREM